MARPLKKIDELLLEKLAKLHLSEKVMADIVGCHPDTLRDRFSTKIEEWRSKSKGKMAEVLFDEAINKRQPWALKALAQRHLDYADKVEQKTVIPYQNISDEDLDKIIKDKLAKTKKK